MLTYGNTVKYGDMLTYGDTLYATLSIVPHFSGWTMYQSQNRVTIKLVTMPEWCRHPSFCLLFAYFFFFLKLLWSLYLFEVVYANTFGWFA